MNTATATTTAAGIISFVAHDKHYVLSITDDLTIHSDIAYKFSDGTIDHMNTTHYDTKNLDIKSAIVSVLRDDRDRLMDALLFFIGALNVERKSKNYGYKKRRALLSTYVDLIQEARNIINNQ